MLKLVLVITGWVARLEAAPVPSVEERLTACGAMPASTAAHARAGLLAPGDYKKHLWVRSNYLAHTHGGGWLLRAGRCSTQSGGSTLPDRGLYQVPGNTVIQAQGD
jgi:hypothetical protein